MCSSPRKCEYSRGGYSSACPPCPTVSYAPMARHKTRSTVSFAKTTVDPTSKVPFSNTEFNTIPCFVPELVEVPFTHHASPTLSSNVSSECDKVKIS